jgi:hypothetical protein
MKMQRMRESLCTGAQLPVWGEAERWAALCHRSFFQQLMVAVDFCHAMKIALTDTRPESMMLVEANDAPSLCSIGSPHGEAFVTPVGGLGRRGVPRLKLFSFRLGDSCGGAQPAPAGRSDAYTAPEVCRALVRGLLLYMVLVVSLDGAVWCGISCCTRFL